MNIKALALLSAGMSAMLMFTVPAAAADELATEESDLALAGQPIEDEALIQQSGSSSTTIVDSGGIRQQQQQWIITTGPTTKTMSLSESAVISTANSNTTASINSNLSTTVIRSGVQVTP